MAALGVGKGTVLNTATVIVGSGLGLLVGRFVPEAMHQAVLFGIGLVSIALGVKLFLESRNVLVVAAAIAFGGILGTLAGLDAGLNAFGEWAKSRFDGHGSATFTEGVVTASVLFCVGPMTLIGCLQEALEGKIELIGIKSTLDGFTSLFLTVLLGPGVIVSAIVVFVVQGTLTLFGVRLKALAEDQRLIAEATAAGGPMMLAIGLRLLDLKQIPVANYLPALILAPAFVKLGDVIKRGRLVRKSNCAWIDEPPDDSSCGGG